ncbi:MAG: PKD domain-containing protein [Candidatus Thermoplasmatota archaeon]|nr:PKD domain-containing protein [Candidatus Thermoplasmatota archaeon]
MDEPDLDTTHSAFEQWSCRNDGFLRNCLFPCSENKIHLIGVQFQPAEDPLRDSSIEPPGNFTAVVVSGYQINLTWTNGTNATHTRIMQKTEGYPENFSDGYLAYNGSLKACFNASLSPNTTYYFRAWSWNNSSGLWSDLYASAQNTTWSAPFAPMNFTALTRGTDQINFSWTKGTNATHTRIMQKTQGYPLNISDGSLVYNDTNVSWSNASLTPGTRYYFCAWSWNNSSGLWSNTNITTIGITGPVAPTNFTATAISTSQINLAWNKGSYANYSRIQRQTGGYPLNISDGINIYNDTGESCSDTGLSPGTTYYYRAWSWNSTIHTWSVTNLSIQRATQSESGGTPPPSSGNLAPNAEAGGPYSGVVNQTVTVSGAGSTDDNGVVGYRWDWTNDGTWDTDWLISVTTTCIYRALGNYTIKLEVKDLGGLTDTDTASITIATSTVHYTQAPIADAAGPYSGLTYQTIQFNGSRSYGINASITNYTWVFGDGASGYGITPVHVYDTAGTFTVILTIQDSNLFQAIDTTIASIILDANRNNISDIMDETIGVDISLSDIVSLMINGVMYYLVDTNQDGIYDVFYNPKINTKNTLGQQEGNQLIDINDDGLWDFIYDPVLGSTSVYEKDSFPVDITLLAVLIIVVILGVVFLVVWSYRTGRI